MKWEKLVDVKIVDDYSQFIVKDIPEPKMVKLVDLSEDSINEIAEAVVRKIKAYIDSVPTIDIDSLNAKHEEIGYEKGYRDGYAEALEAAK